MYVFFSKQVFASLIAYTVNCIRSQLLLEGKGPHTEEDSCDRPLAIYRSYLSMVQLSKKPHYFAHHGVINLFLHSFTRFL